MLIEVVGLSKSFGGLAALSDVNINVKTNELLGITGPNGQTIISTHQSLSEIA